MSKKNRHSKQKQAKPGIKQNIKLDHPIVVVKKITSNGEIKIVNEDDKGNLVLTKEDKARLETVKALQAKAKQARIDAKEALNKAQEAIQALDGSDAIKAIKQDIEARLKAQEDITSKALEDYQKAKEALQSIQSEYQSLTGIDKASKASSKKKASNDNGKFETKIGKESDCLNVIVKHKETNNVFEYSLYTDNGKVSKEEWLKLRHSLVSQFERETKENNLTLRAYLSNLKSKIEAVKAIA